jgi:hypothetical protein
MSKYTYPHEFDLLTTYNAESSPELAPSRPSSQPVELCIQFGQESMTGELLSAYVAQISAVRRQRKGGHAEEDVGLESLRRGGINTLRDLLIRSRRPRSRYICASMSFSHNGTVRRLQRRVRRG